MSLYDIIVSDRNKPNVVTLRKKEKANVYN